MTVISGIFLVVMGCAAFFSDEIAKKVIMENRIVALFLHAWTYGEVSEKTFRFLQVFCGIMYIVGGVGCIFLRSNALLLLVIIIIFSSVSLDK